MVGKMTQRPSLTCISNVSLLSKVKKAAGMEDSFLNESQGQENKAYMCEAEKGYFFLTISITSDISLIPSKMVLESRMFISYK